VIVNLRAYANNTLETGDIACIKDTALWSQFRLLLGALCVCGGLVDVIRVGTRVHCQSGTHTMRL